MRTLFLCTIFSMTAGAVHAALPQCALANTGAIPVSGQQASAAVSAQPAALQPAQSATAPATPSPALSDLAFVRHVAGAGAVITDLGLSHGLHSIVARNAGEFMVFQITADGEAAVSGAAIELTPTQLAAAAAGNITPLKPEHGLDALFVRSGAQFQVFYVTPDSGLVIPGVLWDSSGKDLTRDQVAQVPGAIPTVSVGDIPAGGSSAGSPVATAVLPLLEKASYGTVGAAAAPHLWMLIDPQCIYSVRAYQILRRFVDAGKLRLSIVPLSVLDYEDNGQSTRSALALLSTSPDQMVFAWQAGSVNDPPTPDASARLQANMAIANAIGLTGTPTLIWRKSDGTEGRIDGMPTGIDALIASIGG